MTRTRITDDLEALLGILPADLVRRLIELNRHDILLEVILDLGRVPTARFTDGEIVLLDREVSRDDLEFVVARVGDFDADNRAGIERTLHRISAIRNRRNQRWFMREVGRFLNRNRRVRVAVRNARIIRLLARQLRGLRFGHLLWR